MKNQWQKGFLVLLVICTYVFGVSANVVFADQVLLLSLEDSYEIALNNNLDLKTKQLELEKTKVERQQAKSASKKMEDITFNFEGAQVRDLQPRLKQAEVLIDEKKLELQERNLKVSVEEAYYDVLLAEDNLEYTLAQQERAKTQLKNAELKFKEGLVAQNSVIIAQAEACNAAAELFAAQKELEVSKIVFNDLLGRELTLPVKLAGKFDYEPQDIPNVGDFIEKALLQRPEVIEANEMAEVAKLNADLALKYYASNTYIYKKANLDAKKEELKTEDVKRQICLEVRKAYLFTLERAEKLKASQQAKKAAEETYRIANLKYEAERVTMVEVLEAMERLRQAEKHYASCVYDYNVSKAKLYNWVN